MTGDIAKRQTKSIGLCMIVKNESHVIVRCLESVRPLVDYVLVEDTGSTDDTKEIVRAWLRDTGIPGEVIEEKWRDFGYNRSLGLAALRRRPEIDYALVIDADDVIAHEPGFDAAAFKASLTADLYSVELRQRDVVYRRPQLCSNRIEFLYRGVLHEFIDTPDGATSWGGGKMSSAAAEGFHMLVGLQGARSLDPQKYRNDIDILQRALKSESHEFLRSRYTFYLAQSLRDAGDARGALTAYEKRGEMGFWHEERAVSLYNAAELKAKLDYPATEVIGTYLKAYEASPTRLEPLHGAVRFCRGKKLYHQGYVIAKGAMALAPQPPRDGLFVRPWIYDYGLLDELCVVSYWVGDHQTCLDAAMRLLREGKLPAEHRARVEANAESARKHLSNATAHCPAAKAETRLSVASPQEPGGGLPITVVDVDSQGNPHSGAYQDLTDTIVHGLRQLGCDVRLTSTHSGSTGQVVVIGAHLLSPDESGAPFLLTNSKAVVTECNAGESVDAVLSEGLMAVPYAELAEACRSLVADDARRRCLEEAGFLALSRRDEGAILQRALGYRSVPSSPARPTETRSIAPVPKRLNLGSGKSWHGDFLYADIDPAMRPDLVLDISDRDLFDKTFQPHRFGQLRLQRGYFEEITARDVLEHCADLTVAMTNCLDLLAPGGVMNIGVPYDRSYGAWQDPTHVRAFNERSWLYYCEWHWYLGWMEARFDLVNLQYEFSALGKTLRERGVSEEDIVRTNRAVDGMRVVLRKRSLSADERAAGDRLRSTGDRRRPAV
jgi:glycosyltransferase involved in cell wall biosynthesis